MPKKKTKPLRNTRNPKMFKAATGTVGTRTVAVYRVNHKLAKLVTLERLRKQLLSSPLTTWPTCRTLQNISIRQFHALKDNKVVTLLGQGHCNGHKLIKVQAIKVKAKVKAIKVKAKVKVKAKAA